MTPANLNRPIRICYIAPKTYPVFNPDVGDYFGGANVDLYYLSTEMARDERFESSFVVADYGQADGEVIEGVKLFKALDFRKGAFIGMVQTWRALKRADADIYLMKCASAGVPLTALFCRMHSRIFAYRTAHRFECDGTYLRENFLLGRAFAWSLRKAKVVFSQNQTDAVNLSATLGVSSIVIPNGHRLPAPEQKPRDTILWVGRDADFKKPERFLEMAKAIPNEQFIMVCQTLDKGPAYRNLIAEAGKITNLQFIRHVPFNQIDAYFQRAKVFVNTSDAEGFPNTFIQACKAGTGILSFNVNPDGFLEKYGCGLCCNGDPARLTYNLRLMLENNRFAEYGSSARKYVEITHDITRIAKEYKAVFLRMGTFLKE
ncbi:MAG: glycosyltransferase family 4 protein [Sedimentisphaerales bacterium]|nr:glycosyltransferase family 4 protein [Sedimentisphaerales bacterium]